MRYHGGPWGQVRKMRTVLILISCLLLPYSAVGAPLPAEEGPSTLDVVFVIDNSNSTWDPTYPATDPDNLRIHVARALVDMLSIEADTFPARVGVVTFGTTATLRKEVSPVAADMSVKESIVAAHEDWTVIGDAFRKAYEALEEADSFEPTHRPVVVFLTDGRPQNKREMTEQEISELFDGAQEWVDAFVIEKCPLYILTFNVNETEVPVSDQRRWKSFADDTGGAYYSVSSITQAVDVYYDLIASTILGGYADRLVDDRISTAEEVVSDFVVPELVERLVVVAVRTDPVTQVDLYRPDSSGALSENKVLRSDSDISYRGWGPEDHDVVWAVDRPQAGTWRLEFEGGRGRVIAWEYFRPFEIVLTRPSTTDMHVPGTPLIIEAKLRERSSDQMVTSLVAEISDVELVMKATEPSGDRYPDVSLQYDPSTESYIHRYSESAEEGKYLFQLVLKLGAFEIAHKTENVYVGLTPSVDSLEVREQQDNGIAGLQTGEPLNLRVAVAQVERAEPGTLSLEYSLVRPDRGMKKGSAYLEQGVENIFVGNVGSHDQVGQYTLHVNLMGQTPIGLDFSVPATRTFELTLPPPPVLVDLEAPGRVEVNSPMDAHVTVQIPGRGEPPEVELAVTRGEETIAVAAMEHTGETDPDGNLLYQGGLPGGIAQPGSYTLVVRIADQPDDTSRSLPLSVTPPLWQMVLGGVAVLVLAGIAAAVAYWWFRVRLLVRRIVVGELEIIEPGTRNRTTESLSAYNAGTLTIGRGGHVNLEKDAEIDGIRAKLMGRVEDRRRLVTPTIISTDPDNLAEVNAVPIGAKKDEEVELRHGDEIYIGSYRLVFKYKE